ncbi:carbohydrate ABC transporter permease [Mycoplasmopsis pulmonis]|uniref:carbohydrate ABC transporter permease n=1 Tax=Mycoplasmopsis pulmonis TaxID=2107 RepID=UPI002ACEED2E|nr:ABC transporter permease subunit [Mycoplasmopsis pulmonis]MDZ7293559.1 ABC transporter permease subunit [Mycoplasmopsis pulmonis]
MEKIKLWNWYDQSFDKKIDDSKFDYYFYKQQATNVYNRQKLAIDKKKKIDKNLFIKAKRLLTNEKKRSLSTLKIAKKNELRIATQTIKQLNISNDLTKLINFEINKIKAKLQESKKYVENYYKLLKNSADDLNVKKTIMNEIISNAKKVEIQEFEKLVYLNVAKKFYKKTKSLEITKKKITQINLDLSAFENEIIFEKNNLDFLIKTYLHLGQKLKELQNKKTQIVAQVKISKKEINKKYLEDKNNLKIKYKDRINKAEYSYNKDYFEQNQKIKESLKHANEKIAQNKDKINELNKNKLEKIKALALEEKRALKANYLEYKKNLILAKKYYKLYINHQKVLLICNYYEKDKTQIDQLWKKYKNNFLNKVDDQQVKNDYFELYKKIINVYENDNSYKKQVVKKIINKSYNFLIKYELRKNALFHLKSQHWQNLALIKKDSSYEGDFYEVKSNALSQYVIDYSNEINNSIIEKQKILEELFNQNYAKNNLENKQVFQSKVDNLKVDYLLEKAKVKKLAKKKEITKKALVFTNKKLKIDFKEKVNSLKLENPKYQNKLLLKTNLSRLFSKKKLLHKIYQSKILEAQKSIPTENKKYASKKGFLINLILPGLAEILIFKQYWKGILLILLSSFFYLAFVPFSFGLYWNKIGGVQGLVDLGASIHNHEKGITPDARYWIFGGVVSIFLLILVIAFNLSTAIQAYRNGKFLEQGMRPQSWIQTKKWLSKQGFPWLISIPGWLLIVFIVVAPLFASLLISFSNTGFQHEPPGRVVDWVGFSQYGKWWIFRNNGLLTSLFRVVGWTFIWTFSAGFLVIIVGGIFAILVNSHHIKFKKFFRLIYIIPWAIPAFVTIIFLKSIFQADDDSLVNHILINLGIIQKGVNYFSSIHIVRFLLIIIQTWLGHSYIFLLITGNLQSIPRDIYEAGAIDGAKRNRQFFYITMPILINSLTPLLIGQFIFMFNNFTIINLFSGGGPAFLRPTVFLEAGTDIIISWIYKLTTGVVQIEGNTAFASALVILSSSISVGFASYGFAKNIAKGEK